MMSTTNTKKDTNRRNMNQLQIADVKTVQALAVHNLVPSPEKSAGEIKSERAEINKRIKDYDASYKKYKAYVNNLAEAMWKDNLGTVRVSLEADLKAYTDYQAKVKREEAEALDALIIKCIGDYEHPLTVNKTHLAGKSERFVQSYINELIEEHKVSLLFVAPNAEEVGMEVLKSTAPKIPVEETPEVEVEVQPAPTERTYTVTIRGLTMKEVALLNKQFTIQRGDVVEERT